MSAESDARERKDRNETLERYDHRLALFFRERCLQMQHLIAAMATSSPSGEVRVSRVAFDAHRAYFVYQDVLTGEYVIRAAPPI